ncbi:MAG: hypothetical protein UHD09_07905 [Bifidobacterium sp.]|nr:hypothetical protein [Bifidobacterium sp.]
MNSLGDLNPLRLIPNPARRQDELAERIASLELELDRATEESQWRSIEADRRIEALSRRVDAEHRATAARARSWRRADAIVALTLTVLAAGMLVPMGLCLGGVIDPARAAVRWTGFGLAALGMAAMAVFLVLGARMPRSRQAAAVFEAAVVLFVCSWFV